MITGYNLQTATIYVKIVRLSLALRTESNEHLVHENRKVGL